MSTAVTIARDLWGLLSFILLIVFLRWKRPPKDQREVTPREVPKRQAENDDRDLSAPLVPEATTETAIRTNAPTFTRGAGHLHSHRALTGAPPKPSRAAHPQ
jgi:hypothetical protein